MDKTEVGSFLDNTQFSTLERPPQASSTTVKDKHPRTLKEDMLADVTKKLFQPSDAMKRVSLLGRRSSWANHNESYQKPNTSAAVDRSSLGILSLGEDASLIALPEVQERKKTSLKLSVSKGNNQDGSIYDQSKREIKGNLSQAMKSHLHSTQDSVSQPKQSVRFNTSVPPDRRSVQTPGRNKESIGKFLCPPSSLSIFQDAASFGLVNSSDFRVEDLYRKPECTEGVMIPERDMNESEVNFQSEHISGRSTSISSSSSSRDMISNPDFDFSCVKEMKEFSDSNFLNADMAKKMLDEDEQECKNENMFDGNPLDNEVSISFSQASYPKLKPSLLSDSVSSSLSISGYMRLKSEKSLLDKDLSPTLSGNAAFSDSKQRADVCTVNTINNSTSCVLSDSVINQIMDSYSFRDNPSVLPQKLLTEGKRTNERRRNKPSSAMATVSEEPERDTSRQDEYPIAVGIHTYSSQEDRLKELDDFVFKKPLPPAKGKLHSSALKEHSENKPICNSDTFKIASSEDLSNYPSESKTFSDASNTLTKMASSSLPSLVNIENLSSNLTQSQEYHSTPELNSLQNSVHNYPFRGATTSENSQFSADQNLKVYELSNRTSSYCSAPSHIPSSLSAPVNIQIPVNTVHPRHGSSGLSMEHLASYQVTSYPSRPGSIHWSDTASQHSQSSGISNFSWGGFSSLVSGMVLPGNEAEAIRTIDLGSIGVGSIKRTAVQLVNPSAVPNEYFLKLSECSINMQPLDDTNMLSVSFPACVAVDKMATQMVEVSVMSRRPGLMKAKVEVTSHVLGNVSSSGASHGFSFVLCANIEWPDITISHQILNFGQLEYGSDETLVLALENKGVAPVSLRCVINQDMNAFSFSNTSPSSGHAFQFATPQLVFCQLASSEQRGKFSLGIFCTASHYSEAEIKGRVMILWDSSSLQAELLHTVYLSAYIKCPLVKLLDPIKEVTLTSNDTEKLLTYHNEGSYSIQIALRSSHECFLVSPKLVMLEPGQKAHFTISFVMQQEETVSGVIDAVIYPQELPIGSIRISGKKVQRHRSTSSQADIRKKPESASFRDILSCNRKYLTFKQISVGRSEKRALTFKNNSSTVLKVKMLIQGSQKEDFMIISENNSTKDGVPISLSLNAGDTTSVKVKFISKSTKISKAKVSIKFTTQTKETGTKSVPLYAYGGTSQIRLENLELFKDNHYALKLNSAGHTKEQKVIKILNTGTAPAFVKILPFKDKLCQEAVPCEKASVHPSEIIIKEGEIKSFTFSYNPSFLTSSKAEASLGSLLILHGDEILRQWAITCFKKYEQKIKGSGGMYDLDMFLGIPSRDDVLLDLPFPVDLTDTNIFFSSVMQTVVLLYSDVDDRTILEESNLTFLPVNDTVLTATFAESTMSVSPPIRERRSRVFSKENKLDSLNEDLLSRTELPLEASRVAFTELQIADASVLTTTTVPTISRVKPDPAGRIQKYLGIPQCIDFGCIEGNKCNVQEFKISNSSKEERVWKLEPVILFVSQVPEEYSENWSGLSNFPAFNIKKTGGKIKCCSFDNLSVLFEPRWNGTYSEIWRVCPPKDAEYTYITIKADVKGIDVNSESIGKRTTADKQTTSFLEINPLVRIPATKCGTQASAQVRIQNLSKSRLKVYTEEGHMPFVCAAKKYTLRPLSSYEFTVLFQPAVPGLYLHKFYVHSDAGHVLQTLVQAVALSV